MRVALFITCLNDTRPAAAECRGFGGTFALKNADTSIAMLSDKGGHVLETRAEVCVAGDNSCLAHIGGSLAGQRTGVRVEAAGSLPYASSLCGACYEVRPVKINIPEVLIHLRNRVVETKREAHRVPGPEELWWRARQRPGRGGQG